MNFTLSGLFQTYLEAKTIRKECDDLINEDNAIKGIMITGDKGTGKTTLLHDFLDSFDCEKLNLGNIDSLDRDKVDEVFEKANQYDRAIVYIDDLCWEKSLLIARQMEFLDENVILIATRTPDSRFDKNDRYIFGENKFNREIFLPNITVDMVRDVIKNFFSFYKLNLRELDLQNCIYRYSNCNYLDIINALETAYAGKGRKLNIKDVYPRTPSVACRAKYPYDDGKYIRDVSYQTCISEAGHIVLANYHYENTQFDECYFTDETHAYTSIYHYQNCVPESMVKHKRFDSPYFEKTCIKIAMAGYLSEKYFFKTYNGTNAIKWIREINDNLDSIVRNCYFDPIYNTEAKHIEINKVSYTNADNKAVLKLKHKLFKQLEKETLKFIKENQDDIKKVADYLYEFKSISINEVRNIIPIIHVSGQNVIEK